MSRAFLVFCALVYAAFGLWVLASPHSGLAYLSIELDHVNAMSDLRGSYGGLNIAVGCFLFFAAAAAAWRRPGLGLVALLNGGYVAGRLVSLVIDGIPGRAILIAMAFEAALVVIASILAARELPPPAPSRG
mgnify:CR=1 FL=1|jgi:hypothetical protein